MPCSHWDFRIDGNERRPYVTCNLCGKQVPIHVALNGMVNRVQNLILALIGGLSLIGIVVMLACVLNAAE